MINLNGGNKMKLSELTRQLTENGNSDPEVYVANFFENDEGEIIDTKYFEPNVEVWNEEDPQSHFIIYQGELVSG